MNITTLELMEKLIRVDEEILLDLLGIDSEMLVARFADLIEDKQGYLYEEMLDV